MPPTSYLARRPGPFAALVQAAALGGLRLDPLLPVRLRDRFFDTADGALLRDGLALRVRESDGRRTAGLRALDGPRAGLPADVDLDAADGDRLDLPPGPLARAVWDRVGSDRLRPLLSLRQYRTPRVATAEGRPVALVSFAVVVYEVPGARVVANEVEVEPAAGHHPGDLARLDVALREEGLETDGRSTFERGVLRLPRSLDEPVLLLPDERRQLRETAQGAAPEVRRRAQVVLLDAEGLQPDVIAAQTGVSAPRVRHWRERFRAARLSVLDAAAAGGRGAERAPAPPPADPFAAAPPPPGPREGERAPSVRAEPQGLAAFLESFTPPPTQTPLLDEGSPEDEGGDEPLAEDEPGGPFYPVVLGPLAPAPPATTRPAVEREPVRVSSPPAPAPEAERPPASGAGDVRPLRRPALGGATPLLHAAQATVAYYVAAFEAAAARAEAKGSAAKGSAADVRRALVAVHRVRLALESFRPALPAAAVDRLLAALRPLAADLGRALDAARAAAAHAPTRAALEAESARALQSAVARLGRAQRGTWGDRARRLLARLDEQRAGGLLLGDDFPPPPDDFVGEPGDVPARSRLRHVLGSMLWARYEAVRAFEDEVEGGLSPDAAYHLAVAVSSLHFVLGLAARASSGPVRDVADVLDAAEGRFAAYRHGHAVARLVADAGGPALAVPSADAALEAWRTLAGPAFRQRLAAVCAGIG